MIEYRNSKVFGKNWAWLVEDRLCWRFLNKPAHMIDGFEYHAANIPHEVMEHVPENRRDLVIQAGGNSGLYPRIYSQYFKEVVTLNQMMIGENVLISIAVRARTSNAIQFALGLNQEKSA